MAHSIVRLSHLSSLVYKQQAVWFLNAFWSTGPNFSLDAALREEVWGFHKQCVALDRANAEGGNELNEFDSHRLLEKSDNALTVTKMREVLKDMDMDSNNMVSLTEFMVYKYSVDWKVLVNAPQGCDMTAINAAQSSLDTANRLLHIAATAASRAKEDAARTKEAEAFATEEEARATEAEKAARAAEEALVGSNSQNSAALAELHAQESAITSNLAALHLIAEDDNLSAVKKGKAKAEIAMVNAEDSMPLRMAKISQEAAVRKVAKATKKAAATTAAAESASKEAINARSNAAAAAVSAVAAAAAAEDAIPATQNAFTAADSLLASVKAENNVGEAGQGQLYYIDRELEEAKKYLPKSRVARAVKEAEEAKVKAKGGGE